MASILLVRLFSPIGIFLILLGLALLFWRWRRLSFVLVVAACIGLYLASTPFFSYHFHRLAFPDYPPFQAQSLSAPERTAIVVLGGGRYYQAREYSGEDIISAASMDRVRMAAKVHRETGLPILATGYAKRANEKPEAEMIRAALQNAFRINAVWTESKSKTTAENAQFSAKLLRDKGKDTVVLVTHFVHMPRAARIFAAQGLTVIPAPTRYFNYPQKAEAWLPKHLTLTRTSRAWYELLAQIWYTIKK